MHAHELAIGIVDLRSICAVEHIHIFAALGHFVPEVAVAKAILRVNRDADNPIVILVTSNQPAIYIYMSSTRT